MHRGMRAAEADLLGWAGRSISLWSGLSGVAGRADLGLVRRSRFQCAFVVWPR
jgi:hypothetical protein